MWADAWSPDSGDSNLFTAHFGALLSDALITVPGAVPVFRSAEALDHFSVWLPGQLFEFFPFHKTQKMLLHRDGESLVQLYDDVVRDCAA